MLQQRRAVMPGCPTARGDNIFPLKGRNRNRLNLLKAELRRKQSIFLADRFKPGLAVIDQVHLVNRQDNILGVPNFYANTVNLIEIIPQSVDDNFVPVDYMMSRAYPNPFNNSVTIEYQLSGPSQLTVVIYDMLGRKIETVHNGFQDAGEHTIRWDADNNSTGVYFYSVEAGDYAETKKIVLLR